MVRKKRFTREDILEAAFQIVRKRGIGVLTARAIGEALSASTMPVYTPFAFHG